MMIDSGFVLDGNSVAAIGRLTFTGMISLYLIAKPGGDR
jgi:hypothetical protein